MKQKSTIGFMITGMLFVLFLVLTVVVALVDVQPIGPLGSEVGLSTLNRWVFDRIGVHPAWETVTDLLGLVALACAAGFGVLGFCQLIKRKKLWKVDHELLVLGVFYCLVLSFYVLFEILVINHRPILIEGELEASYPSSHTMLIICIMSTAMMEFHRLLGQKKPVALTLEILSGLILGVTVIGRLLAGIHWFTDIVGGALLASALVSLYVSVVWWIAERKGTRE